ncbi:MAG: hypothetical protein AB8G96_15285 [Phycisphaerales bacterium]
MARTLQARLDAMRESFQSSQPADVVARMHHATNLLRASGQADAAVGDGDAMPSFELASAVDGSMISSGSLLAGLPDPGALIVTFFRGHW